LAQTQARESAGTLSIFGGNITMGRGATLELKDNIDGSSGVSGVFRPKLNAGVRVDVHRVWLGLALELSTTIVESPITMTKWGSVQSRRIIRYIDTGGSLLLTARAPVPVFRPYAGLGPSLIVRHSDSEGEIKMTAGLLFVAGTQLWITRRVFGFAEARYNLLADRHYTFNTVGMQDAPFATMVATVSGSHSSLVFGIGMRIPDR
jgi:hypothetical protein